MKKFTLVLALIMVFCAMFVVSSFAEEIVLGTDNIESATTENDYRGTYTLAFDGNADSAGEYWYPNGGWAVKKGTTATIVFDKEYYVTSIEAYFWSNGNEVGNVRFFDANGAEVAARYINWTADQNGEASLLGENVKVKSIQFTRVAQGGDDAYLQIFELVLTAHVCEDTDYTEFKGISYPDGLAKAGVATYACATCGAEKGTDVDPIFDIKGYSIKEDLSAITCDFEVNKDALAAYEASAGITVNYGVIITGADKLAAAGALLDDEGNVADESFVKTRMDRQYDILKATVTGLDNMAYVDAELVFGMFVEIDGTITTIQSDSALNTVLDGAYNTMSMRKVAELTNVDGVYDAIVNFGKED